MKRILNRITAYILTILMIGSAVFVGAVPAAASELTPKTVTVTLASGAENARENLLKLQQALEGANKNTALTVKIAAKGTYYVGHPTGGGGLALRSNTTLDLNGSVIMRSGNMYNLIQNVDFNGDRSGGGYSLSYNIGFRNGTLDGTGGNAKEVNLVNLGHADGITVQNIKFQNCRDGHMIELSGCRNAVISNCTFDGYIGPAKEALEAVQIDISYNDAYNPWNGAYLSDKTPCKNIKVDGCTFYDYPSGVGNHHTAVGIHSENITITNNKFYNKLKTSQPAIWAYGFENSTVSDNVISGNYETGIGVSGGSVAVTNNTVTGVSYMPLNITAARSYYLNGTDRFIDEPTTGGLVTGNKLSSTGAEALSVYHGSALSTISNNTIRSSGSTALMISGNVTVGTVKNNDIYSSADCGIWAASDSKIGTVSDNTVYGKVKGVNLTSGTKVTAISDNEISSVKECGLYASSSSCTDIKKNSITCTAGCGIWAASDSKLTTVSDNTVKAKTKAVNLTSGAAVASILNNQLSSESECGIYVSSGSCTNIKNNSITCTGGCGIWAASDGKLTTVSNNTVKAKTKAVNLTSGAKVTSVVNNQLTSENECAVYVSGSNCTKIKKNTVASARNYGIWAASNSKIDSVADNTVSAKCCAVYVTSGACISDILYNTLKSTNENGICITGSSSVNIVGNKISGCGDNGIHVASAGRVSRIQANDIRNCKGYGFVVYNDGITVAIGENTFSGNRDGSYYSKARTTKASAFERSDLDAPVIQTLTNENNGVRISWDRVNGAKKYRVLYKNKSGWAKLCDTASNTALDKVVKSGVTYTYSVRCLSADGSRYTGALDNKGKSITFVVPPAIKSVSSVKNGLKLAWSKVGGAASYRVFRKNSKGAWVKLADTTAVTLTDANVTSGSSYTYTVRCLNKQGAVCSGFNTKGWKGTFYSTLCIKTAVNTNKGIQLSWNAVRGVAKYRVFYKNKSNGWSKLGDTAATTMFDQKVKSGTTYTYMVRGLNKKGNYIGVYDAKGYRQTYIAAPQCALSCVYNGVKLSWSAVSGAKKYRVLSYSGGSWHKVADTTGTSAVDTKVSDGKTYTYTVRCLNANGTGYVSDFRSGKKLVYYAAPALKAAVDTDGVRLSWNRVNSAAKYRVFWRGGKTASWTKLGDTAGTSMVDRTVASGSVRYYTIRTLDSKGKNLSSYHPSGVSAAFIKAPEFAVKNDVDGVVISWKAVKGAEKYRVYLRSGDSWTPLALTAKTSYKHTGTTAGNTYTYTVRCVNADGSVSASAFRSGKSVVFYPAPVLELSNTDSGVNISWRAVSGAAGYRLFRKDDGGAWRALGDVRDTVLTDTNVVDGYVYTYTARVLDGDGNCVSSYYANGFSVAYKAPQPPVPPTEPPTEEPTAEPTEEPTAEPTEEPTAEPTEAPTAMPIEEPTQEPVVEPTEEPTEPTESVQDPTSHCTMPIDSFPEPTENIAEPSENTSETTPAITG